jgi:hypothetical protein
MMPLDLDWIATVATESRLGSQHPLFLVAATMEILFLVTFLVCAIIIDADPVYAAVPDSAVDRTAAPELLLIVFLVYATIIDVVGTWRREGGFYGGGMVKPKVVKQQASSGLCHHHLHRGMVNPSSGEAVLPVGMWIHTLLQRGSERDVSIAVVRWNQWWRCGGRGGHHRLQIVCSNYSNSSGDKISL